MLIEVARQKGNYLPDSHSVRTSSRTSWRPRSATSRCIPTIRDSVPRTFFRRSRNVLQELLPEFAHLRIPPCD